MDNFYDTALRMANTSKILHDNSDYHNSCYTAGYVVECYAKTIVETYSTRTPRSFSHNLTNLDLELKNILGGNSSLSIYIVDGANDFSNILTNWNPVTLRYLSSLHLLNDVASDEFQSEIDLAMQKLTKMKLDGLI